MAQKTLGYVNLVWTCPNCQTKNPGPVKTCGSCGSPQPDNIIFEQVEGQEFIQDPAAIENVQKGADIHCGFCGARNPSGVEVCGQCGADLKQGKQRESGQVLGAYQKDSPPRPDVACPSCGAMNPATSKTCSACGADLQLKGIPNAVPDVKQAITGKKLSVGCIAGIVVSALILVCVLVWLIGGLTKQEKLSGKVQSLTWERVILVEELKDVTREAWKDEIPSNAQLGDCKPREHNTQKESAPQSTEVCGTPYTIDKGNGAGQVVQDCEYHVYQDFCQYRVKDWVKQKEFKLTGSDSSPVWPKPTITQNQREGGKQETYQVIFDVGGKAMPYSTSDTNVFAQFKQGSRWNITVNGFDQVTDVEPAN